MRSLIFILSTLVLVFASGWGTLGISEYYNMAFDGQSNAGSYLSSTSLDLIASAQSYCTHCLTFGLAYLATAVMGMYFLFRQTASGVLLSSLIAGGILLFESILLAI